ncbi:hypothetical protein FOL47_003980 [Perkinsus chesapeaki]|uniref:Protein kinase domain-containing protein n=1 Tax=Perkinsus chesapeaki TaxID=330153 RepID=A0A7J6MZE1_PERCH|nr:hypothetical protein FOL47_003980 [Perkinsus chesapeaki]
MSTVANVLTEERANELFEEADGDDTSSASDTESSSSSDTDSESDEEEVPVEQMDVKELRRQRKAVKGLNTLSESKLSGVLSGCTIDDLLEIDKLNGEGCFESSEAWNEAWQKAVHMRFTEGMIKTIRKQMESTHGVFSQDASTAQLVATSARRLNRAHLPLDDVLRTLRGLEGVEVTMEDLKLTKIGKVVNTIMKTSMDPEIKGLSKSLVSKWRKVAADARQPGSSSSPSAAQTPSTDEDDAATASHMCEWRQVYQFYKDKLQASRDRARKARETGLDAEVAKRQKRTEASSMSSSTVIQGFRLPQSHPPRNNIVSKTRAKKRAQAHYAGPVKKKSKRSAFTEDGMMVRPVSSHFIKANDKWGHSIDTLDVSTASSSNASNTTTISIQPQLTTSCPIPKVPIGLSRGSSTRLIASATIPHVKANCISGRGGLLSTKPHEYPNLFKAIPASLWVDNLSLTLLKPPLSNGPFSAVSRGLLVFDGEAVVVKSSTTDCDLHILSEVRVLSKLNHPNIVRLRGVRHAKNGRVQALLHDIPLSRPLSFYMMKSDSASIDSTRAASLGLQLTDAVEYIHFGVSPVIIHRDIKPDNILVTNYESISNIQLKLIDFGLALELAAKDSHVTSTHPRGGTVRYMAPENYDLHTGLTRACDVWSCALVLNQLFGGSQPYPMCTTGQQIAAKIEVSRKEPHIDCDKKLWPVEVLEKSVSLNPEDRPSIRDLRSELAGFVDRRAKSTSTGKRKNSSCRDPPSKRPQRPLQATLHRKIRLREKSNGQPY